MYAANPYAAAAGGFFAGIMASRERRAVTNNIMRTCMADKGYRRFVTSKILMKELGALRDEDRTTRLHGLAADPNPKDEALPR